MTFKTANEVETIKLGEKIGKLFKGISFTILLDGDLASGKTTLVKGIARGLGIKDVITSPTYTILKEYLITQKFKLYHLDLYRLKDLGLDFDLEDYINDENGVVVIEWPFQIEELLPEEYIKIEIKGNQNDRILTFSYKGKSDEVLKRYEKISNWFSNQLFIYWFN